MKGLGLATFLVTVIALCLTATQTYMQYHSYQETMNPKNHEKTLNILKEKIKQIPEITENFDPLVKVDIKDFDFIMDLTYNDNYSFGDMNNSIIGYNPGQYMLSSTPDGMGIISLIESTLDDFIEENFSENIVIYIEATGTADGIKVGENSRYDGLMGDKFLVKYFRKNNPNKEEFVLFEKGETKMKNEYFAVLRVYDVVKQLKMKYNITDENIRIFVIEYEGIGDKYRRCDLKIRVENAFLADYENLNFINKRIIQN